MESPLVLTASDCEKGVWCLVLEITVCIILLKCNTQLFTVLQRSCLFLPPLSLCYYCMNAARTKSCLNTFLLKTDLTRPVLVLAPAT